MPERFEDFRVEAEQLVDVGEHVAVIGRFRGTSKSGNELDATFVHVATIRDGKEVEFHNYVAGDQWAEAWS